LLDQYVYTFPIAIRTSNMLKAKAEEIKE